MIRQPIVSVLAHVDHGKTTLLDTIRNSAVAQKEAGGITQCIDATEVPIDAIKKITKDLLKNVKITIPGLLFIDTPGHEAFSSLRKRGGAISDLAILIIDINQGVQPQTRESIEILKTFKVPFVVALNKIDMINGWKPQNTYSYLESIKHQNDFVKEEIQNKVYEIMGELSSFGFDSDLFTNISDYTKTLSIIPISGKTGEGIAELLAVLVGMAQKYLENRLEIDPNSEALGTILEVKEVKGLGKVIDAIIYDGSLKRGDLIVIGTNDEPIVTKVKALLKPKPLTETREKMINFRPVDKVVAACGVRIAAPDLDRAVAGMPLMSAKGDIEKVKEYIKKEISSVKVDTQEEGVVIKVDTLGSLEAILSLVRKENIPIKKAEIGPVSKSDVITARNVEDKYLRVIFAFNTQVLPDAKKLAEEFKIKIFRSDVIYKILEDYEEWKKEEEERERKEAMAKLTLPAKIRILPGYVFRQSKPAVCGIEVLEGKLTKGSKLMNAEGKVIGEVKDIQDQGESIESADKGMKVAISIEGAVIGRNVDEGEDLWTDIPLDDFKTMTTKYKDLLRDTDLEALRQILELKRKHDPMWGL